MKSAGRTLFYVACALIVAACGGGGGGGGSGNNGPPAFSVTASQTSVSLQHKVGALATYGYRFQDITLTYTGPMLDIQSVPDWLSVTAMSNPRTSPEVFRIRAATEVGVGDYSTTLRFRTSNTDGSNVRFADVSVSLHVEAGTNLVVGTSGLATGGSTWLGFDDGSRFRIQEPLPFPITAIVAPNVPFTLTVTEQPQDQRCMFNNGETSMTDIGRPLESLITGVLLYCYNTLTPWTWMGGSQAIGAAPVHGTRGTPSTSNTAGAREPGAYAADAHGNLYLFGGTTTTNRTEYRNDLWRYDIDTGTWTWLSGSNAADDSLGVYGTLSVPDSNNVPGARIGAVAWVDGNGDFWLFGGEGYAATFQDQLNDVWKYDVDAGVWTWMGGSNGASSWGTYSATPSINNIPGGREDASVVQDAHGDVWIFGGYGVGTVGTSTGNLNDLWRFTPGTGEWTWMSGSDQPITGSIYGTRGVPDAGNYPDGRANPAMWADANGNLWIFGGLTWFLNESRTEVRADLWRYDSNADMWTWMSGSTASRDEGQYSVPGTSTTDMPSARYGAAAWSDAAGNFWMFGGDEINDLWKYAPATNTWSWRSGGPENRSPSVFGTQGVGADTNIPSGRSLPASWADASGRLWLYGGDRSYLGRVSDVWRFDPQ